MRAGMSGLILATLLLGGCNSGEDDPKESPSPTASPTSLAEQVVETPERPVDEKTDESAAAFAEYASVVYMIALATGDTSYFENLTDPNCQGCQDSVDQLKSFFATGQRVVYPGPIEFSEVKVEKIDEAFWQVEHIQDSGQGAEFNIDNPNNAPDGWEDSDRVQIRYNMRWVDDAWKVALVESENQ